MAYKRYELSMEELRWLGENEKNFYEVFVRPEEPEELLIIKGNWETYHPVINHITNCFGSYQWDTVEFILSSSLRCQTKEQTAGLLLTMGIT